MNERKRKSMKEGDVINNFTLLEDRATGVKKISCQCSCGVTTEVWINNLLTAKSKYCRECMPNKNALTHGEGGAGGRKLSKLYMQWNSLKRLRIIDPDFYDFAIYKKAAIATGYIEGGKLKMKLRDQYKPVTRENMFWVKKENEK